MIKYYEEIFKLKTILRNGWKLRNAKDKISNRFESDAEHTFSMCMLALYIINKEKLKLDELKVLKMILFHELGEIDAGDITPFDNISKHQKYELEFSCIKRISDKNDMPELLELWLEFENNQTAEAQFVKQIDKLDAVIQSKIYSSQQNNSTLFDEFYEHSKHIIADFKKYL